ncbi:MAG: ribonuclease T [gamma proteobacterium symbiont of Bathyaustriella thionipta]|nr:ribonuclease T [gamma proteobacterium symbiont of Bathyaustriella thionipta]MCU7948656.1 ribonuclease T [gamma proteobacterium symbiont of Bathyaustriella thionipta]MCU7953706.1 ribonuclease T [gamma proteobacterium symbiont of Bathyaustriella thionipta]MCU7955187.1 ribonuclease T [gamma proteobacterium symbiont of Bathyaustriella thionipta]MCU7968412.1 ribonuclease T [gamma proteobacterium symbiont of Bathyaustriella thionipta]
MARTKKKIKEEVPTTGIAARFRGFLPVVVDVETAGFNHKTDALLEVAATLLRMDEQGDLICCETYAYNVEPFKGANLDASALKFTGINPFNPFRMNKPEEYVLKEIFQPIRCELKATGCSRAILVGHNPTFDLNFINAAIDRNQIKRNPFHKFSTFDTATLGGLAFGQTVLSRAAQAAGMEWCDDSAHSAKYDTEQTAELFCRIINRWHKLEKLEQS